MNDNDNIRLKVNNLPVGYRDRKYIVFRMVDGAAWFYDCWDDIEKALQQAIEIGGQFVPSSRVE